MLWTDQRRSYSESQYMKEIKINKSDWGRWKKAVPGGCPRAKD